MFWCPKAHKNCQILHVSANVIKVETWVPQFKSSGKSLSNFWDSSGKVKEYLVKKINQIVQYEGIFNLMN